MMHIDYPWNEDVIYQIWGQMVKGQVHWTMVSGLSALYFPHRVIISYMYTNYPWVEDDLYWICGQKVKLTEH